MSKVIGLTCHETSVRGLLQLSAVLLTSVAAVRSHQAESFLECFLPLSLWLYDPSGWRWGGSTAGVVGIHPSVLPCGLQWLLFGLAIRVYHNLIRSLVRLVGGALMEEGKSVLTCGKLRSQQQSLISMMHLTLLSTSIKVANVLTGAACSFRNTSVLRRVPNRIPLCFKLWVFVHAMCAFSRSNRSKKLSISRRRHSHPPQMPCWWRGWLRQQILIGH